MFEDKVSQVAHILPAGQMFTIDWIRLEDGTQVSINGKLHRKDSETPYLWYTKKGEARVIMTGSAVSRRTANRNDGKHERNQSTNDVGMAYWTVPLSNVTHIVANGMDYYFGRDGFCTSWVS